MSKKEFPSNSVIESLISKGNLKQDIYINTMNAFNLLKNSAIIFNEVWNEKYSVDVQRVQLEFTEQNIHEFKLKFAGDTLVFMMHTNIFEFPRAHEIMKLPYVKENPNRAYCGVVNIYNFLSDSFKYKRINDSGYLVGRIFVNFENHYFVEGKKEIAMLVNNFTKNEFDKDKANEIVESAVQYSIDFDLLIPPYDIVKEVLVLDILQSELQGSSMKTAKRMGFRFQADKDIFE
ncbi:MAG: hypothetical protein ACOXZK_10775 [Bacteroidales bacterium]|jgi:hypothetical protein|nr:hypothetical protein [Bacteroidales bacterium]